MIVVVRPWKFPANAMITAWSAGTPLTVYPHLRATLIAVSTASPTVFIGSTTSTPGQIGQLGAERPELVVLERAADQREMLELALRRRDQPRVPVAEVKRRVRGEQVEV